MYMAIQILLLYFLYYNVIYEWKLNSLSKTIKVGLHKTKHNSDYRFWSEAQILKITSVADATVSCLRILLQSETYEPPAVSTVFRRNPRWNARLISARLAQRVVMWADENAPRLIRG